MDNWACPIIASSGSAASGLAENKGCSLNWSTLNFLATWSLAIDFAVVVELSWFCGC